ncbi:phage tail protein [Acinetobacter gyllenbergii]|uniref:pyocin knob domain-containing protein n=1 Tax=Acinetobacter gyllenbergii TaxID=134534 RepID=UPI003F545622
MTKQTIAIGSAVNDGTGDPARTCFTKTNGNFTELYDFIAGAPNTTVLPTALPISKGGTGSTTATAARTALGLGNASQATLTSGVADKSLGRVLKVGDFGLGVTMVIPQSTDMNTKIDTGMYYVPNTSVSNPPTGATGAYINVQEFSGSSNFVRQEWKNIINQRHFFRSRVDATTWTGWGEYLTTTNTTMDANGFVKAASPIVKLFAETIDLNQDAQKQFITFEKLGVGNYLIKGSLGFAQEGWYIEVPKDANGNTIVAVVYDTLENGDISIKTYKRKFDIELAAVVADLSKPIDIHEGRWIDVRLHEEPKAEVLSDDIEQ